MLIEVSESQTIEFKERISYKARELAENIASFATSKQGTIYVGINNSADQNEKLINEIKRIMYTK
jgi:predicted HTH transcriptional regulator